MDTTESISQELVLQFSAYFKCRHKLMSANNFNALEEIYEDLVSNINLLKTSKNLECTNRIKKELNFHSNKLRGLAENEMFSTTKDDIIRKSLFLLLIDLLISKLNK